ncbi:MAG: DUF285 domain-containing protein [Clostridiales bacterium]|nr:DUF285 domain-containing protein [Clostridiales bacterium]
MVWRVTAYGSATQAWSFESVDESTFTWTDSSGTHTVDGAVVGYKNASGGMSGQTSVDEDGEIEGSTNRTIYVDYYVVVAYKVETTGTVTSEEAYNEVTVTVTPYDGYDAVQTDSADASWDYTEYDWVYSGYTIGVKKYPDGQYYKPWLDVYEAGQAAEVDTGSYSYTTLSVCRGYEFTHNTEGDSQTGANSTSLGEYIPYTWYSVTTVDDVIYVYPNGEDNGIMLDGDDYYFSSVTITQTDIGYDVWEDKTADPESSADAGAYYLDENGDPTTDLIDQGIWIYAKFATSGTDEWEYVDYVAWDADPDNPGTMTYTFSNDDIAKEPYRVMVVHDTINYETDCQISVNLTLKYDSPTITAIQAEYEANGEDLTTLEIEDISGVSGYYHSEAAYTTSAVSGSEGYIQESTDPNYSQYTSSTHTPDLESFTEELYNSGNDPDFCLPMRDNAWVTLTSITKSAASYKTATAANDAANGRVVVNYMLTAYEGYEVSDETVIELLKGTGLSLPERTEVVFYDLLPYGMKYDASVTPTAGRIASLANGVYQTNTRAWDTSCVTVTVNDSDIIENWNGSGRTLVAFHLTYTGDPDEDEGLYSNGMWYKGWGVSFQAYYDYDELDVAQSEYNIAAFMPDKMTADTEGIYGTELQTYDIGEIPSSGYYDLFENVDLNGSYYNVSGSVLYAEELVTKDVAVSAVAGIEKLVKADSDVVGDYSTTAVVESGGTYTYEITITNGSNSTLSDIVIYDILEYALQDGRYDAEYDNEDNVFLDTDSSITTWSGTLLQIYTDQLKAEYGIEATVYYNAGSGATISETDKTQAMYSSTTLDYIKSDILTAANGWYTEDEWLAAYGDLTGVRAIAIDISTKTDGTDFTLGNDESVTVKLQMQAPTYDSTTWTYDSLYAYNNPSWYSLTTSATGTETMATVIGDTVRVEIGAANTLTVQKYVEGEVPTSMSDQSFTFTLKRSGTALAQQEYTLYNRVSDGKGGYEWVADQTTVHSTDANGQFTLKADQQAVFNNLTDIGNVTVEEEGSYLWSVEEETVLADGTDPTAKVDRTVTFTNTYQPIIYVQKETTVADSADLSQYRFKFRLLLRDSDSDPWEAAANVDYIYIESIPLTGVSPTAATDSYGNVLSGTTDADGCFTLAYDEYIALLAGSIGGQYKVEEVAVGVLQDGKESGSTNDNDYDWTIISDEYAASVGSSTGETDWVSVTGSIDGTMTAEARLSFTNRYKYRDLYLLKSIEGQDEEDCTSEFTFCITDSAGEPVNGLRWVLVDADGNEIIDDVTGDPIEGITGDYDGDGVVENGAGEDDEGFDGCFTVAIAGESRRVKIEGLVAGETYTVTEEAYDTTKYMPVDGGTDTVRMPVYSSSAEAEITNQYLLKFLSVTKTVLYDDDNNAYAANNTEFEMTLYKYVETDPANNTWEWQIADGVPYTLDGASEDGSGNPYETDSDGKFYLKNGQTVVFTDIGYAGDKFMIVETEDSTFKQVYPSTSMDPTGTGDYYGGYLVTLTGNGGEANIINGSDGLLLTKEYTGLDTVGEAYVAAVKENERTLTITDVNGTNVIGEDTDYAPEAYVTMYLYVKYTGSNEYVLFPQETTGVEVKLLSTAGVTTVTWEYNSGIQVYPWQKIYIPGDLLTNVESYYLTEAEDDQLRLEDVTDDMEDEIDSGSVLIEYEGDFYGDYETDKLAMIINDVSSAKVESVVYKVMSSGSSEVTAGAAIVFRVERYSAADDSWTPASDIPYIVLSQDDAGDLYLEETTQTTGSDGLITVTKSKNGYPVIRFTEDTVHVNYYEGMSDGDLRVVEVADGTNEAWGILAGYQNDDYTITGTDAEFSVYMPETDTFVNANDSGQVIEVEKVVDGETTDTFTFRLNHVLSASTVPITDADQILDSEPGAGLYYVVYDSETNEKVGDGYTDSDGRFTISAGQYVQMEVPDDTVWTVYELLTAGWELVSVTGTDGTSMDADVLDSSSTGVFQKDITVSKPVYTLRSGSLFLSRLTGNIIRKTNVTSVTFGRLKDYPEITGGTYTAYDIGDMSDDLIYVYRVKNDDGTYHCYVLADGVIQFNENCQSMFSGMTGLSSIEFGKNVDTSNVKYMQDMFYGCSILKELDLSGFDTSSVTNMQYMFYSCNDLKKLDLSGFDTRGVTSMAGMFGYCKALEKVDLSSFNTSSVTSMMNMFYYCTSLTELDLSSFNTSAVWNMDYMFYGCSSLTTIYVGDGWTVDNVSYWDSMFGNCSVLVGGYGTSYAQYMITDKTYAVIDTDGTQKGYLTYKN